MSTLSSTTASRTARWHAGLLGGLLLAATAAIGPHATTLLPAMPGFLPSFGTATLVLYALTAFLLAMQFRMRRNLDGALLAAAYGFATPVAALQVLLFPGAFVAAAAGEPGLQAATWLWVFARAGWALLVLAAFAVGERRLAEAASPRNAACTGALLVGLPAGLAAASGWLAIAHGPTLAGLVGCSEHGALWDGPVGVAVWVCNAAALVASVRATRLRTVLHLWLAVALLAAQIDVTLTLLAGARFTLGWYAARTIMLVSASAVLGALLWEIDALYRRAAASNELLAEMATRDALTGLFNRRHLDLRLAESLREAQAAGRPLALLLLDLDHFKAVNDDFGHAAGDAALRTVAAALSSRLRRGGDVLARYGGEEFAVVLPDADTAAAAALAERLRQAVAEAAVPAPIAGRGLTVSIGVAVDPGGGVSAEASGLLRRADAALYAAKRAGRNRVQVDALAGAGRHAATPEPEPRS